MLFFAGIKIIHKKSTKNRLRKIYKKKKPDEEEYG